MSTVNSTDPSSNSYLVQPYDLVINSIGCLITGVLGFVTNLLALLVIYRQKRLHTPCFSLMAGECVSSVLMALGIFFGALDSVGQQIGWSPKKRTRGLCYVYQSLLPALTTTVSALIACLISMDRLISILMPIWYRKTGKSYVIISLIGCLIFAISAAIGGLLAGPSLDTVINCAKFSDAFGSVYNSYYKGVNLVVCAGCVVAYLFVLISFHLKARRLANSSNSTRPSSPTIEQKMFAKQQSTVMPAVKLLMVLYTLTGVLPTIAGNVLIYVDGGKYFARGYQYNYILKSCNPLAEVLALFLRSKDFRGGVRRLFGGGGNEGGGTTAVVPRTSGFGGVRSENSQSRRNQQVRTFSLGDRNIRTRHGLTVG